MTEKPKTTKPKAKIKDAPKPEGEAKAKVSKIKLETLAPGTAVVGWDEDECTWYEGVIESSRTTDDGQLIYRVAWPKYPGCDPTELNSQRVVPVPVIA